MNEKDTVKFALTRLECELAEIKSLVEFLRDQDPTTKLGDLIDGDVKESIWAYLGEA